MRKTEVKRKTKETDISLVIDIDGSGIIEIDTGIAFFDHMLNSMCRLALFDISLRVSGDTVVDDHHTVEDTAIVLGQAIYECTEDKNGINRYGQSLLPMDDVLLLCGVDLSGRAAFVSDVRFRREMLGGMATENIDEFFRSLAMNSKINLMFKSMFTGNAHHTAEAMFKSAGLALRQACEKDERINGQILTTKGAL